MIILLAITIFIIFVLFRMSSDSSNTATKNTTTSTTPPALSVQVSPTKPFDSTNPHEIYNVVHLLSAIVANKSDSYLFVGLQDEDLSKGWTREMILSVMIRDWHSNGYQLDPTSFVKLGLPLSAAQYLASVPFSISGGYLEYKFPIPFDYPSTYARFIVEEMEKGTRSSPYVQNGHRRITIENRHGVITCKSA